MSVTPIPERVRVLTGKVFDVLRSSSEKYRGRPMTSKTLMLFKSCIIEGCLRLETEYDPREIEEAVSMAVDGVARQQAAENIKRASRGKLPDPILVKTSGTMCEALHSVLRVMEAK